MRILHVTPTYFPNIGGIETVVNCLSRETMKHGIVADVAHVAQGLRFSREESDGQTVWRIPLYGHSFAGIAPKLGKVASQYDLLHVHDPQLLSITANIRAFCPRVPAVLSTHGGFRHTQRFARFKAFHERHFLRLALASYRRVLASSTNDSSYFGPFTDGIMLAENGIDTKNCTTQLSSERSVWKWLYWGRIAQHKRLDLVCDLAVKARSMGFPVELTICGPVFDSSFEDLQNRLEAVDAEEIRYLGPQDDTALLAQIAEAGLYVTASEYEGFGLTVLEAMATGLPVIARAIPPIDTFVSPGTGLLLRFDGSPDDDAALDLFLTDLPKRATDMDSAARKMAAKYSWETRVSPFLDCYRQVLDEASEFKPNLT
jgi:alpha-1,3-mannosyltransferase